MTTARFSETTSALAGRKAPKTMICGTYAAIGSWRTLSSFMLAACLVRA